jgi:hypothetical protein
VPLIDNAPGPVHGRPVSGFVPVMLERSPLGVAGEMLSSDRACKSVLCSLSTGLVVFWASAVVAVRMMAPRTINTMNATRDHVQYPTPNLYGMRQINEIPAQASAH